MAKKKVVDEEVIEKESMVEKPKKRSSKIKNEIIDVDEIGQESIEENDNTFDEQNVKEKVIIKEKNNNSHKTGLIYALVTFIICLGIFSLVYEYYLKNLVVETTRLEKDVTVTDVGIADAVEKIYDAVVVVQTYNRGQEYASGTGFVYKTDNKYGYIITNNHVISNSSEVKVKFSNDKFVDATVIGSDSYADIAVLSVDKDSIISVASIGKSENMRVGDTTFAVGAPIDSSTFSWSVTRGILSGKNRIVEVEGDDNSTNVISVLQTDTAINSGNSGGPLCNSNGEVVGVTNMKLASSSVEGMGFAIPIEEATKYADAIIKGEKISRPYLGVSIYDASRSYFRNNNNTGIYIEYVENGSAAYKAGLQKGDKIVAINEKEVTSIAYFKYELFKYDVGEKITITIERNGKTKKVNVTLGTSNDIN